MYIVALYGVISDMHAQCSDIYYNIIVVELYLQLLNYYVCPNRYEYNYSCPLITVFALQLS